MMNLLDILQNAQGGQAMANLSRQFDLSQEQTEAAVQSLLPAFQMGLERQTQNMDMFTGFMQDLASGRHAETMDKDGDGIPDEVVPQGNEALSQLFGPKEVSRAVAAQAAATTGLSTTILKSMLPVIASMVMGGLFKNMSNQGFGGLLGQLAQATLGQGGASGVPQGGMMGGDNPLGQILGGMFGGQQAGSAGNNPLGGILGSILGGGQAQGGNNPLGQILGGMFGGQQQAQQQPDSGSAALQAGLDALTSMFNAGTQTQQAHMDGLQSIFEQMTGGRR